MSDTIYLNTRDALVKLFPPPQDTVEATQVDLEEEGEAKKAKKVEKRTDGLLETDYNTCGYHLDAQVPADQLIEAVKIVDSQGFFIESITGVDWIKENELEVVYDFCRYDFELCRLVIRVRLDRENPIIPTITPIYTGANWHERETHDFFGIKFDGHPHLIPLLLPEDADFHPLLKDFTNE